MDRSRSRGRAKNSKWGDGMTSRSASLRKSHTYAGETRGINLSVASAARTLDVEAEGLAALKDIILGSGAEPFGRAVEILKAARRRVIVTGIGKSGHVGQKLAATFASTGTPAFFVHPSEAAHGDLGMVTPDDVVLAISWSGETVELKNVLTYSRRFKVPLIAITSQL